MTENEVLKDLQNYQGILKAKTRINAGVNPEIALNAVTEAIDIIEKYRAIGTVEEIENSFKKTINAFEKANPLIKSALDILQEYQSIGTIEDFKALKNKHIGKDNMVISSSDLMTILNSDSEELKQYKEVGTVEEFKALKEKSVAKKPLPKGTHKGIDNFYCSNCNHPLTNRHEQCELPYCEICGQLLDWSE